MSARSDLGGVLRTYRQRRLLTQPALAELGGVHPSAISHYESGSKIPSPELAQRLDSVLDLGGQLVNLAQQAQVRAKTPRRFQPNQLPVGPQHLIGRDDDLAALDRARTRATGTPIILEGPAGIGKTALTLAWAHQHASEYPDGVLFIRLRGHSHTHTPTEPGDALAHILRDLGSNRAIPDETEGRERQLRSLLQHRRMLLVLDDAADTDQLRPLLVGSTTCTTLITSRRRLPGLAIQTGAPRLALAPLEPTAGVSLLHTLLGPADPDALERIAAHCDGLPLALHAAATYLADRPHTNRALDALTGARRLHLLTAAAHDDPATALRAVFAASVRRLPSQSITLLHRLGTAAIDHITEDDAARLLNASPEEAEHALDALLREHLLIQCCSEGYHCPSLLRLYAAEIDHAHRSIGHPALEQPE